MAKVVVKSKAKKVKKKFPVNIKAPEFLNSVSLGESNVTDLNNLVGRTSKINLMYITGNLKNQNIRLTYRIEEVSAGEALTIVKSYEQIPYYLGRFVRKGSNLIEDSFDVLTKDGKKVRVKPFVVTKMSASELICKALRGATRELVKEEAKSVTYDELMASIIFGKIQNVFRNDLKKIFPLKTFEFRKVELK